MRGFVAMLLVAACAGRAAADTAGEPPGKRPGMACTKERVAELAQRLRERWSVGELELRCVAGQFGAPGYFIDARGPDDLHRAGILAADGRSDIVPFTDVGHMMVATSIVGYAAGDLDGDGVDEIVEHWRRSAHGRMGSDNWLVVRKIAGGKLSRIPGPHVSIYDPVLGRCSAEWKLAPRALVVTVQSVSEMPPSDCLSPGVHTFTLKDGALVKKR